MKQIVINLVKGFTRFLITPTILSICLIPTPAMAKIVHYEKGSKAERPDLSKAVICADIPGNGGLRIISRLRSLKDGPQDFSEPGSPCDQSGPYVRIYPQAQNLGEVSNSGSMSGYGSRGGYSSYVSFSGNRYTVQLNMDLVRPGLPTVNLGFATVTALSGFSSESTSSFGRRGGGTLSSQGTTPEIQALNSALNSCETRLFNHGFFLLKAWHQFWNSDVTVVWIPGGNETVQAAFAK